MQIRYIGLLANISLVTCKPLPIFFGMQLRNSQIFKSIFSRKALQRASAQYLIVISTTDHLLAVCIHAISITLLDEQTWELGLFSGWASSLSSMWNVLISASFSLISRSDHDMVDPL